MFNTTTRLLEQPSLTRHDSLLGHQQAWQLLATLDKALDWQQPRLRLFGREHPIPRRQVWMGDAGYRYSGRDLIPVAWHPEIRRLGETVVARLREEGLEFRYNSVLLNRYADGEQRMGWHSDNESELGSAPVIAAVSLGDERALRFRWKDRRSQAFNVTLPHDSLLLMGPGTQRLLEHSLPSRRHAGLRISLTFRWIHA